MKEIKLFDYQQEMLENITEVFSADAFDTVLYNEKGKRVNVGSSVMVQMPMGTGKTYVMAAVVKWFLDTYSKGEVWLIAHRKELVEQLERTLDRFALDYGEKNFSGYATDSDIYITQDSRHGLRLESNGVPYVPYFQTVSRAELRKYNL